MTSGDAAVIVATCHKLSGVAAVFGHPAIGDTARTIESAVKTDGLTESNAAQTTALATELRAVDAA